MAEGYGSHAETGVPAPALTWYLAEGATHGTFNLFYLLQNPTPRAAGACPLPAPERRAAREDLHAGAGSRTNIWVNLEDFPGSGKALASDRRLRGIRVLNGQPIIVERAMYLDRAGRSSAPGTRARA